jgi:hypothetical protein
VRIRAAESLRFPEQGSSAQGESGPKPRPKGVGDGQPVDIPVPVWAVTSDGVTQRGRRSGPLVVPVQACKGAGRQIPRHDPQARVRGKLQVPKWPNPNCPEKPLARNTLPVLQTDTGGRCEKHKARGRTLAKELGKIPP